MGIHPLPLAAVRLRRNPTGERAIEPLWWITRDGDQTCLALYERHYSAYRYRDGRERKLFIGPGAKICLRTQAGDAMFVWKSFRDASGQQGVNCAVFRNEGPTLSSLLVRQADAIADHVWPGERHYTYVDPSKVRSRNPGYCFLAAGWRRCGRTKGGLLIMERLFPAENSPQASERSDEGNLPPDEPNSTGSAEVGRGKRK